MQQTMIDDIFELKIKYEKELLKVEKALEFLEEMRADTPIEWTALDEIITELKK